MRNLAQRVVGAIYLLLLLTPTKLLANFQIYPDKTTNPLYLKNSTFLQEPELLPQLLVKNFIEYDSWGIADLTVVTSRVTIADLIYGDLAIMRFDESLSINPKNASDFDYDVDQAETVAVVEAGAEGAFSAFMQFDLYPKYISDYFKHSYPMTKEELGERGIQLENNELYQFNLFYLKLPVMDPFIFETVIKYVHTDHYVESEYNNIRRRYNKKLVAWELMPKGFAPPDARNQKEKKMRGRVNRQMSANSGYMTFEPLTIDGIPQGLYEELDPNSNQWVSKKSGEQKTLLNGISYMKTNIPFPNFVIYPRQYMMESITTKIVDGLRAMLRANEKNITDTVNADY